MYPADTWYAPAKTASVAGLEVVTPPSGTGCMTCTCTPACTCKNLHVIPLCIYKQQQGCTCAILLLQSLSLCHVTDLVHELSTMHNVCVVAMRVMLFQPHPNAVTEEIDYIDASCTSCTLFSCGNIKMLLAALRRPGNYHMMNMSTYT
jgi:hypothetical protein